nr:hypothetical protein GCM10020241_64420 [Streptoalloteichus tenebrarius]
MHPVAVVVVTAAGALVLYCWASWMFLRGWPTLFGLTNWMDRQTIASSGAVFGSVETIAALMTDSALANVQSKSALAQASVVVLWLLPLLGARIPRRRSARVGLLVGGVSGLVGFVLTVILRMFPPTASSAVSPEAVRSAWWAFLLAFAVLAQVVAAALAGRSAPSTALMAAYATIAPALVLIVLSVTVCGCLPGDGLPDAVCLRPPGWLFLAAHLGLLAIAVPMTGTLGALLGMALRAVRQPSITPEQEQNRTRHRAALPLLAGTLAMAAGVASAKHLDAEDNAPPAVMTQPTPTTKLPRPSSPFEAAYFVAVWYTGGGKTHMDQVRNTVRAFISSPSENTCSAMGTATRQAMAFARAPDDTAQRTWHAALQAANRAGGQCGTGRWNDAAGSALTADEHLDQLVLDLARALTIPK